MATEEASKKSLLEAFKMVKLRQQNELRKSNEFCDLTLKSEDGFEIKVHRVVVSSASNYFKDLLTLPMKEKFQESILVPDITADVLEKIITFIYTSEFDEEKIEDAEKLIKYAAIFQLQQLIEICSLALSESITDHNCLKYWRFAKDNLIYGLADKCLAYIAHKAEFLFESSLMNDLTIEDMRSLLADKRLHLQCNEKKIFEHAWKWAEGRVTETKNFSQIFSEVVALLHFSKLEKEFVYQKLFEKEDVLANTELLHKVAKLTKQKYEDEAPGRLIFHKSTQRRLFGLGSNKMFTDLGEESIIEKEINLQNGFSYTTFNNKLLICGGEGEYNSFTNSCKFFEPSTQQWKKFPTMKTKKKWHQCSYLGNKIYTCGGIGSSTVEIFDLGRGEWDYGPEMLANNYDFGLSGVHGALYAIGGETDNVEVLDPRAQKWSVAYSDFRRPYKPVRCVSIGPCIYCFSPGKRYIFDTRSHKFTEEICFTKYKRYSFGTGSNKYTGEICWDDFDYYCNYCELDGYIYGLGYQNSSANKSCLNLVQYHPDGSVGFKKPYGLYNVNDLTQTALVSLYY